ncbi:MAG: nucleotidyltransferase family protein [Methanoregula sp.]
MDALSLLRQHEPELKKRFGIAAIGIFGSFIRGEERPESDVDVLVSFRRGQETFDNYMDCKFYLEDLFGRKVDLIMKGAIKKRLKPYILGEVVYA